ncbi:hypothetical protein SZN_04751 [Streptomyces zinciresistens K42]|uniref:Uncharacterized protein n=1 Tax=Streptomyces zinciresistens K42 TaxID=700597 RepID=G2G644_9ACTN|nr:hypothetical protein SZN_04751 [Streptomyces zinciresistens K42]
MGELGASTVAFHEGGGQRLAVAAERLGEFRAGLPPDYEGERLDL